MHCWWDIVPTKIIKFLKVRKPTQLPSIEQMKSLLRNSFILFIRCFQIKII